MRLRLIIAIALVLTLPCVHSLPCTDGACCKDGILLPKGTECRQALDDCDVTEYCTGFSSDCPPDQLATNFEKFCKSGLEMGVCENGTCMTTEVIKNYLMCQEKCSAERGKCTSRGVCVCNDGWQAPPKCDKKTDEENDQKDPKRNVVEMLGKQNEHFMDRNRRNADEDVLGSRINDIESSLTDKEHKMMLSIQDPPHKSTFTRLKEHHLFIPTVITVAGFIILVAFAISAKIMYQSELKAKFFREMVKVEKTTSKIPKDVSRIDDPTINVDVGQ